MPAYLDQHTGNHILPNHHSRVPKNQRGTCGAKTRKGRPCKAPPVWNKAADKARNGRCKLHGGKSTGPRTEAGREAIGASNRKRKLVRKG